MPTSMVKPDSLVEQINNYNWEPFLCLISLVYVLRIDWHLKSAEIKAAKKFCAPFEVKMTKIYTSRNYPLYSKYVYYIPGSFVAQLFLKETSWFCHNHVCSSSIIMQKLSHFLISLLLPKIFTCNSDNFFLSKGEPMPVGQVTLEIFLTYLCPFFDLEYSKSSYRRTLAPVCGSLVYIYCH